MIATAEASLLQAREQFEQLIQLVCHSRGERLDRMEATLFEGLLAAGLKLLTVYVVQHGTGDVGPTLPGEAGTRHRQPELHPKRYVSIFGELTLQRTVYRRGAKQKQQAPLDAELGVPQGDYSYLLANWLQRHCLEEDFAGALEGLRSLLPVVPALRTAERLNRTMAQAVPDYQEQQPLPEPAAEPADVPPGEWLVATADGKGVPMVPDDRPMAAERRDDEADHPGTKRMAYAGAVYTIAPFVRTAEDVLDEVQRQQRAVERPKPQGKVLWAELPQECDGEALSGRDAVLANLATELDRRDPTQQRPVLLLFDGERALWQTMLRMLIRPAVVVLDLWHVLTYLWTAARVFHSQEVARKAFVTARLQLLLTGKVGAMIGGLKQMATKHRLSGEQRRTLAKVIGYLERNREHMDYAEYLRQGYPIGSGVIEGACRHVIKDRMERTGMNWTIEGARAVLRLRVVHTNGHWEDYQDYRIAREQAALYGDAAPHARRAA